MGVCEDTDKAAEASNEVEAVGTFIDLTVCDGCKGSQTPACVTSCRSKNQNKFPEPIKEIPNYWPQNKKEDWSDKKDLTSRLTPYNWTFVQKTKIEHNGRSIEVNIPRRCMHCTNPPCAGVCPWGIPARQAGVGLYLNVMPDLAGGGVMYKCDLCIDRVRDGQKPACVEACPKGAIKFGERSEMLVQAKARAKEINGFIYGENENGGTSTFYVSPVPYDKIDKALKEQKAKQPNPEAPGYPGMPVEVGNFLDTPNGLAAGILISPFAGLFAAGYKAYKTMKGEKPDELKN